MLSFALLFALTSAVEFDLSDPIASHPDMVSLVNQIVDRNSRRGLVDAASGTLSQRDKDDILALHNKIRAETARGEYQGSSGSLPEASDMNYLLWSDALATVAADWSSECVFAHRNGADSCNNALDDLSSVDLDGYSSGDGCGENLYASSATASWSSMWNGDDYGIRGGIEDNWCVDEAETWSYGTDIGAAGHYTQVVWADSKYVGCGFADCSDSTWMGLLFTCNYYPAGNVGGQYPYSSGTACDDCSAGCSSETHTPQSGTPSPTSWDLSGLCTDTTPTAVGTPSPTTSTPTTSTPTSSAGEDDTPSPTTTALTGNDDTASPTTTGDHDTPSPSNSPTVTGDDAEPDPFSGGKLHGFSWATFVFVAVMHWVR